MNKKNFNLLELREKNRDLRERDSVTLSLAYPESERVDLRDLLRLKNKKIKNIKK